MSKPTRKRPSLDEMTEEEARAYVQELRTRLLHKQQRERAWLDRCARHGVQTRTDDDYERDQDLESELVALLDKLLQTE